MENIEQIKFFTIVTEDGKTFSIDFRITQISKLFFDLCAEYNLSECPKLNHVVSSDLEKLVSFCEMVEYAPIQFEKPFTLKPMTEHLSILNPSTKDFYTNLDSRRLTEYAMLADFFNIPSLENLIYLKLHEVFLDPQTTSDYFKSECPDIVTHVKISNERESYLRERYMLYCEKFLNSLTDQQVQDLADALIK